MIDRKKLKEEKKKVAGKLRLLSQSYATATVKALYTEALEIFADSQQRVPVDTGRLRSSGLVFIKGRASATGLKNVDAVSVSISYGTDYALAVHEGRRARYNHPRPRKYSHPKLPPQFGPKKRRRAPSTGGEKMIGPKRMGSKYLSEPFYEAAPGIQMRVLAEVEALVATGITNHIYGVRRVRGRGKG